MSVKKKRTERKRILAIVFGVPALLLLLSPLIVSVAHPRNWAVAFTRHRQERPIDFYGKVVDMQGRPIEGAWITIDWASANWPGGLFQRGSIQSATVKVRTNANGRFEFHRESGLGLSLAEVEKRGYTWVQPTTEHGTKITPTFSYRAGIRGKINPTPTDPYVIKMKSK